MVQSHCIKCKWRGKLYSIYSTRHCSRADSWLQHSQPEPPLRQHMPATLRSVLFLVLTRILCSKDFNFFCLLQATAGGMSRAFFSSDEVCSHGCEKEGGERRSSRQEQPEEWDMWRDLSFGRRIWTKALEIGLKQIRCLRARRQLPLQ